MKGSFVRANGIRLAIFIVSGLATTAWGILPQFTGVKLAEAGPATWVLHLPKQAVLETEQLDLAAGESLFIHQPAPAAVVRIVVHSPCPARLLGNIHADGVLILTCDNGWYFGEKALVTGVDITVSSGEGKLANRGCLAAPGGAIRLTGKVIEQSGRLLANSLRGQPGVISLLAESNLQLGATSVISARGDTTSPFSPGGQVTLKSGWDFLDAPGSRIATTGGNHGGDGGNVEVSAVNILAFDTAMDAAAAAGSAAGQLLLDPININLVGSGTSTTPAPVNGTVDKSAAGSGTLSLNVNTAFQNKNFSTITLEASGNISLAANLTWDLSGANGYAAGIQLSLLAGGNITLGSGSKITDANNWSIALQAGYNFTTHKINQGSGNIYLNGGSGNDYNGSLQAGTGSISLLAGNSIQLGSGSVTAAGGNLLAQAGGDLTLRDNASLFSASGSGAVTLQAGYNFSAQSVATGSGNLYLNGGTGSDLAGSLQAGTGAITLQAGNAIQLGSGSVTSMGGNILAQAGGDLTFLDNASHFSAVNGGAITLQAGYNYSSQTVSYGTGNLYLDGAGIGLGGYVLTDSGAISLAAGLNITVGSGYVITTAGGGISAHALEGNIDTGSDAQGYHFNSNVKSLATAYDLSRGLGGISTEAGGNVNLIAGGTVTSVLPEKGIYLYDGNSFSPNNGNDFLTAGAGAYGRTQAGNFTVVAGGNVTGHYLVANGTGSIFAGVQMDATGNPVKDGSSNYVLTGTGSAGGTALNNPGLSLSLVHGGWNVAAAQNILLQEVNNPNGMFNNVGGSAYNHVFDYLGNEFVNLSAGNLVQLGFASSSLARVSGTLNNVSIIYPASLNLNAGPGGVILGYTGAAGSLALFPSPQGSLTIATAGSLVTGLPSISGTPQQFNLIVSDSGSSQYTSSTSFSASDHAFTPVHLNSSTPMAVNLGGDMNLINLIVPEAAQVNVAGNLNNCGLQAMNLSTAASYQTMVNEADGTTRAFTVNPAETDINVAGDIYDRGNFTSVSLTPNQLATINLTYLGRSENSALSAATLTSSFFLNGSTLTYQTIPGQSLTSVLQQLNNLTVQVYSNGIPQWQDPPANSVPVTQQVSLFGNPAQTGTVAYNLLTQFNTLGAPPANAGINIGGGGKLAVSARSIDLGSSSGIQSLGGALYRASNAYPLAGLFGAGGSFSRGTDIAVNTLGNLANGYTSTGSLQGDLDLFSSSIDSLFGGNISLNIGGALNAGSAVFTVNSGLTRGLYTSSGGDVSVVATGDVNVYGSRIITYDGGNLTVESKQGDINAGSGASTPVIVTGYYEDPVTHTIYSSSPQIPFSGIVATTFPARDNTYPAPAATLGSLLLEAPNGSINGGDAGIAQIALNSQTYPDAQAVLLAGYEMRDNLGNPVDAAHTQGANLVLVSANRDINFINAGSFASNAKLDASGGIYGHSFMPPPLVLSSPQLAGSATNFTFQLSGPAGSNYVLQVSTDLLNWSPVSTSAIPATGSVIISNGIGGNEHGFFRAELQ